MSDFRAKIIAELDTSKIPSSISKIEKQKISLNNFTLNTSGLGTKIQQALNSQQFTLNLTNVKVDNLSKTITGQMSSAGGQAGQQFSQNFLNKIKSQIDNSGIDAAIAKVQQKFNKLDATVKGTKGSSETDVLQVKLNTVATQLETLKKLKEEFSKSGTSDEQLVSNYENFNNTLSKIKNSLTEVSAGAKEFASSMEVATLQSKLDNWLNKNTKKSEYRSSVQVLSNELKGLSAQGKVATVDVDRISNSLKKLDAAAAAAGAKGKSLGASLSGAFKSILKYVNVSTLIYKTFDAVKNGVKSIVELDTALVDLQKTTNATTAQLKEFYYSSNDTAKSLGVSTKEVIQAAADWSRLGYSLKDAQTMAETSSIFSSISPGMGIEMATDGLVSSMKAFDIEAQDALDGIASKINAIGNSQAVSNDDIVEFLTRSSSAMSEANNTLEETIALGTAATEITRDAASVGNALKTKFYRLSLCIEICA